MTEIAGTLGIELVLLRDGFKRDLQALQSLKGGQIALQAVLDTRLLRQQINNLSQLKPTIQAQVAITNLNQVESQLKTLTRDRRIRVGIELDGAGLDRLEARLGQLGNRSVRVGIAVDDSAIDRLNGKLNALSDRVVRVGVAIDESGLTNLEKRLGQFSNKSFRVTAQVDDRQLTALNKHLDLKQKHFTQVNNYFKSSPLTPRVDFSGLDALDRRLNDFKNRSIDIKANIADVRQSISQLKQELSGIEIPVTVRTANGVASSATQTISPKIDSSSIESAITKALDNSFKGFEKNLEGAFKKVGKGNILGGLGDILTAPLKLATGAIGSVFSGVGLGVGQQISKDLGKGISEGIDAQLAPIIGSFRLVGRELASSLVKELVDSLGQDATLVQGVIQDLVGKDNILVESGAVRSRQKQQQQKNTVEATRFFQNEAESANVSQLQAERQKLGGQFAAVQELKANTAQKTEAAANKLGAGKVKQNIEQASAQLKQNQETAATLNKQINSEIGGIESARKSLSQLKSSGTADASQIAEVESGIAQKTAKLSQLQSELGTTTSSSKQIAERITRLTDSLAEINRTAESYFREEVERITEIEDKLSVAQRKLEQKLQPFEAIESLGKIRTPESIGAEVQARKQNISGLQGKQSQLRASAKVDSTAIDELRQARNQELQVPDALQDKDKIQSIERRIIQIQERQAKRKALYNDIGKAIAQEETQLRSLDAQSAQPIAVQARASGLNASLSQLAQDEAELNRLAQEALAKGDEARARRLLAGKKQAQEDQQALRSKLALLGVAPAEVKKTAAKPAETRPADQSKALPASLQSILEETAALSGVEIPKGKAPRLVVSDSIQGTGQYDSDTNTVAVSSQVAKQAFQGKLTEDMVETFVHEFRHAVQSAFGQIDALTQGSATPLLQPTAEELANAPIVRGRTLAQRIEGSAANVAERNPNVSRDRTEKPARLLEADAYTFAARNTSQVFQKVGKDAAIADTLQLSGIGGQKIRDAYKSLQSVVGEVGSTAKAAGLNIAKELNQEVADIAQIGGRLKPLIAKLGELDVLPADEIRQVQQQFEVELAEIEQAKSRLRGVLANAQQDRAIDVAVQNPLDSTVDPEALQGFIERKIAASSQGAVNPKYQIADPFEPPKSLQKRAQEFGQSASNAAGKAKNFIFNPDREVTIDVDKLSNFAQKAGGVARGGIETGKNVASAVQSVATSQPVQAVLGATGGAVKALGAVAKTSYQLASGLESIALDMIPLGRTIKGVTKQLVIPAAGFAAATHLLPGGAIAAEGLSHLVGGAITPLTQAAGGAASASASSLIAQAIPQTATLFGHTVPNVLAPAAAPITSAVTGAIQGLSASVGEMAVQAGTVILGGKLLQGTVGKAGEAALKSALPQESNTRALPAASTRALPPVREKSGTVAVTANAVSPQVEIAPTFEQFTKPQLLAATRKLGIQGTNTKTSKDDLVERLKGFRNQSQVDQVLTQVQSEIGRDGKPIAGFNPAAEKAALKQFQKAEKDLHRKLEQLAKASGKKRETLLNEILSGIDEQTAAIDAAKAQNFSGETVKQLSGIQGRLRNAGNNNPALVDARNERITTIRSAAVDSQNARIRGLARVAIEEAEPATATLGTTLKEGFRKLTNFAAKQFEVQPQPTIKGTLGAIAKSPKARDLATDLAVNGAGFAASQLGSQFGILPELTGDLGGALIARQLISRGRPSAKDLTGDLAGFAIGNTTAKIANAGLDALSGVVPGAGLLRALPFKGAIAASLTVPKVTKAAEQFQQSPIEGLARAQTPTGFTGLVDKFRSLLPNNERKLAQIQRNYESIYREIAAVSGAAFDPANIPKLSIDNKRLKQLGAQAYFEIEQNLITIDREIANALAKPANELSKYTDKLTGLIHEGRHSIQLDGGRLSIDQAAASGQLANGDKLSIDQRAQVEKSVDVARKQGASAQQLESVRKLETDAYAFEGNAGQIVSKASRPDPLQAARLEAELASRSIGSGATIQGLTSDRDIAIVGRAQSNAEKFDQKAARIQRSQDKVFAKQVDPLQGGGEDAASRLKGTIAKEAGDYAKAANESLKALGVNLPGIGKALSGLFSGGASDGFSKINGGLKFLAQNAAIAIKGFVAFQVLSTVVPAIQQFATESVNAAIKLDNLKTALSFGSGGASNAVKDLAFVRGEATRLGVPLSSLQDGFVKLSASTKGTSSAGQTTKDLITGLAQASTTLGLSAEESGGAILALSQIASKGSVQAEELRGQLGERIPGAFGIAARAMGVTEGQLNKLLETGSVTADEFLPKLGRQLQIEFAGSAESASKNVQSSFYRLGNSFQQLQEKTGKVFTPNTFAVDGAAKGIDALGNSLGVVIPSVITFGLVLGVPLLAPLFEAVTGMGRAKIALDALGKGFNAVKGNIGSLALKAGISTIATLGAIEAGRTIGEVFSLDEEGKQFEDLGNKGQQNLERIAEAAKRAKGEIDKVSEPKKSTSKGFDFTLGLASATGLDQTGFSLKSDDLIKLNNKSSISGFIPGFKPFADFAGRFSDPIAQISSRLTGGRFEFRPGTTVEELQQQRDQISFNRFLDQGNNLAQQAFSGQIDVTGKDGKRQQVDIGTSLKDLKATDDRIQQLRNERGQVASQPKADKVRVGRIDDEIQRLTTERAQKASPLLELQASIQSKISDDQNLLKDDKLSGSRKDSVRSEIQGLENAQALLNRLQNRFETAADTVSDFKAALNAMNVELEQAKRNADLKFSIDTTGDIKAQIENFGSDINASIKAPVQAAIREAERSQAQLEDSRAAIERAEKKAQKPGVKSALDNIRTSTGQSISLDSSVKELEDAKAASGQDEAKKKLIDELIDRKRALDQESELEQKASTDRLNVRKAEEQAKLALIQKASAERESQIKRDSNTAQIGLLQKQKAGNTYESDIQVENAKQTLSKGQAELDSTKQQLDAIESAYAANQISAEEYEKQRREIGDRISDQEVQNAQNEVALVKATEQAKLSELDRAARKREASIKQNDSRATASLVGDKTNGLVSDDVFSIAQAKNSLTTTNAQQSNVQAQLDEIEQAYARGIVKKEEYEKRSQDLTNSLADLSVQKAQNELALREAIDKKAIESQKRLLTGTGLDQGLLGNQGQAALIGIDLAVSQKRLGKQETEASSLQQQLTEASGAVNAGGDIFAQFDNAKKVGSAKEIEERLNRITASSSEERTKIRELELQRDLKLIQARAEAEERELDRKKSALDSELKLSQAIADSRQSQLKIGIDRNGESVDAFKQLQGKNAGYQLSKVLKDQLTEAGFNTSNTQQGVIDALQNKQALEAEADREKVAALLQQQALERESVKLGLQKEQISARTALNEAKRVKALAKLNLAEAQGGLAKARRSGNADEIQSAQEQLKFAQEAVGLAGENKGLAELNVQSVDKRVQNELAASDFRQAQQRSELDAQNQAAYRARRREAASTADEVKFTGQLNFANVAPSAVLQAPETTGLPSIVPTVTPNTNQVSQTVSTAASTTNNADVVAKLEQLYTGIIELANKPRSLTFNTAQPVDDYAKFMNDAAGSSLRSQ
jgi:tape measure domain-containing protein